MAVKSEAVERAHFQGGMDLGVVTFLDPVGELAVEDFEAGEIKLAAEELIAHGAEEAFDFSFGSAIAHGGVVEEDAETCGDLTNLPPGFAFVLPCL